MDGTSLGRVQPSYLPDRVEQSLSRFLAAPLACTHVLRFETLGGAPLADWTMQTASPTFPLSSVLMNNAEQCCWACSATMVTMAGIQGTP